jgi:uncharacterized protein involved in exopolysaccharide biosynthesis
MTFVEYVNRPPGPLGLVLNYTIKLPWTLKDALGSALSGPPVPAGTTAAGEPLLPSEEEEEALQGISNMVSASVDEETGLISISLTAGGPQLATDLAKSFLGHFTRRVREIRTEKVRKRLSFVEGRFQEVKEELEGAEDRLAKFLERNQNPTTATLQFRRDRLQRQVSFKEQLYSDLQSQLTQTRLDLQRRRPVVTVVEKPSPPLKRSAPKRTLVVILSLMLGGILGCVWAFIAAFLYRDEEERNKLREVQESLLPKQSWTRMPIWRAEDK